MTCFVTDCGRSVYAKGLCNMHWQRQRNGVALDAPLKTPAGRGHTRGDGYHLVSVGSRRYAHILIAERALGHALPAGAEVHHVNENPSDNRPENLVICPSTAYHRLIHQRTRAREGCGHPDWRICVYCREFSDPSVMVIHGLGTLRHRHCSYRNQQRKAT